MPRVKEKGGIPGIPCPKCSTPLSEVKSTRFSAKSQKTRAVNGRTVNANLGCIIRKRVCFNGHTFTTEEWPVHPRALAGHFDAAIVRMLNEGKTWPQIREKLGVSDAPIARIVRQRKGNSS